VTGKYNNNWTYSLWVWLHQIKSLVKGEPGKGVENAVGGNFDSLGVVMSSLLIDRGLEPNHFLIDVGCGSGRLTKHIDSHLEGGKYLGLDIIGRLVKHASTHTKNPNFQFSVNSGFEIPAASSSANMVCFFSVFTHLLHEHSYCYLQEAKRVLKPGGKVVFSFLEFGIESHWSVFENNIKNSKRKHSHLNMFISRDGITRWAEQLGLEIEGVWDGDKPHIPLASSVTTDEGTTMEGLGWLGQSVCVLVKKQ